MKLINAVLYYLKINISTVFSSLITLLSMIVVFHFVVPDLSANIANMLVYNTSFVDSVWFSKNSVQNDCFVNLNGETIVFYGEKNINADIFMQMEDVEYTNNLFSLSKRLNYNECVMSENIAAIYNISVGDKISTKNIEFTVKDLFQSQKGIDDKYNHKGIVVLPYNELLMESNSFIFFAKNSDGYFFVDKVMFLENEVLKSRKLIIKDSLLICLFLFVLLIVEKYFFKKNKNNYLLLRDGVQRKKIFLKILISNILIYILPLVLTGILFIRNWNIYRLGYLFSFILIFIIFIISIVFAATKDFRKVASYGKIK